MLKNIIEKLLISSIAAYRNSKTLRRKNHQEIDKLLNTAIEIKSTLLETIFLEKQVEIFYLLQNKISALTSQAITASFLPVEIYKQLLKISNYMKANFTNKNPAAEIAYYYVQIDLLINLLSNEAGKL